MPSKKAKQRLSLLMAFVILISLVPFQVYSDVWDPDLKGTGSILNGQITVVYEWGDETGGGSIADDKIEVTAWGNKDDQFISKITLTNASNSAAKITFDYKASNYSAFLIQGVAANSGNGTYSVTLDAEGSIELSITGPGNSTSYEIATLTLNNFSLEEVAESSGVTFVYNSELGSITANGETVPSGTQMEVTSEGVVLSAAANSGTTFLGWIDTATGERLSENAEYTLKATGNMTVKAAFAHPDAAAWFNISGTMYCFDDLAAAITQAASSSSKTVVLMSSGTLAAKAYTIPSGVKFLIPYSASDTGRFNTLSESQVAVNVTGKPYATLTVPSGGSIVVEGDMNVNGVQAAISGSCTGRVDGDYGHLQLDSGASLTLNSGGTLTAYGYITGDGTVTANSDSTVYELLQIADWRGGSYALEWYQDEHTWYVVDWYFNNKYNIFPISQYYIQNIEADFLMYSGAVEKFSTAMNMSDTVYPTEDTFIGSDGLVNLTSGVLERNYDAAADRMTYTVRDSGKAEIQGISLNIQLDNSLASLLGLNKIELNSTNDILPINSNLSFVVKSGSSITVEENVKLLPDSEIIIEDGGELVVSKNLYIYGVTTWTNGSYVESTDYKCASYSATRYLKDGKGASSRTVTAANSSSGRLQIDGTMTVNGTVYTTNGDTDADKVIFGSGKIINNSTTTSSATVHEIQPDSSGENGYGYANVTFVPMVARLAGSSASNADYKTVGTGSTYSGLGDTNDNNEDDEGENFWYQKTFSITGEVSAMHYADGGIFTITNDSNAVGYYCASGDRFTFAVPLGYIATAGGTTLNGSVISGTTLVKYTTAISDGMTIHVAASDATNSNATIHQVLNEKILNTTSLYIPTATDVSAYYSDAACTIPATTSSTDGIELFVPVTASVTSGGTITYYETLASAVDAAASGDTVRLLTDIQVDSPIAVSADQSIAIDLCGFTITYSSTVLNISGTVDLDLSGGAITSTLDANASALVVRKDGTLDLDLNQGEMTWTASEGSSFAGGAPIALVNCNSGGTANITMNGGTISVEHPNAVTAYTLHAVYNSGAMKISGEGTITSSAYTSATSAYVSASNEEIYGAPTLVNTGDLTVQNGVAVTATAQTGTKNFCLLNYYGGSLTLDGVTVSAVTGYAVYNWGATIESINDCSITSASGICNYNMASYAHNATIREIVGDTTITATGGYGLSTHPDTYVGVLGGEGSAVEIVAGGNAINSERGVIGELADGLTVVSTNGYAVYTRGIVELVSGGYYCGTTTNLLYADMGYNSETGEYNYPDACITFPEGYALSQIAKGCTLRDGSSYLCSYLTNEEQAWPDVLSGHLQNLPDEICGGTNLWTECGLVHDPMYYATNVWKVYSEVVSITIPVTPGDRIWATSFQNTPANNHSSAGVRVTWFNENGVLDSVGASVVYSEFSSKGYLTVPEGATAVNIPMWTESEDNEVYILGHDYEFVDEDGNGWYTAVCANCGEAHDRLGEHLQVPESFCSSLNLWSDVLEHDSYRHDGTTWSTGYKSITIPVEPEDKIYASSFGATTGGKGIRVTWFMDDGSVYSVGPADVYTEFTRYADESTGKNYLPVPEGAIAVCVTMWNGTTGNEVNVLNRDHDYKAVVTEPTCTAKGCTTYTCACGDSYTADETEQLEHSFTNYVSNGDASAGADGTKTAYCDYGCGTTDTVTDEGSSEPYKKLAGKVISVMGDSISTFAGWIPTADGFNLEHHARYPQNNLFTDVEHTWWYQLIFDELDAKLGINESWRSTEIGNVFSQEATGTFQGTKVCMASTTRIQNMGSNGTPDIILFYGGTNDYSRVGKDGRASDIIAFDPEQHVPDEVDLVSGTWESVTEAYVTALMRMHYYYPNAKIVCMFPTYTSANADAKLTKYNAILKSVCDYFIEKEGYDIVYVDLHYSGVTLSMLPDGTHPNEEGMDLITAAVLETLLENVDNITEGEHLVHTVDHQLTNTKATLSYYKGVDDSAAFSETVTGENLEITVTMGVEDITESSVTYNDDRSEATITVDSVGAALTITASGESQADILYRDELQQLPAEICGGLSLMDKLALHAGYYSKSGWSTSYYSVTIPVTAGDRLWATSFQDGTLNNHPNGANGIRVTWFMEDGSVISLDPNGDNSVYNEFSENGYLTAPDGAVAVNVPFWTDDESNELYILNLEHCFDDAATPNEDGITESVTCTICGTLCTRSVATYLGDHIQLLPENICPGTNLWTMMTREDVYYKTTTNDAWTAYNDSTWGSNKDVHSVTFPVKAGARIWATSFQANGTTVNNLSSGIRITWFSADGKVLSWNPSTVYSKFSAAGYLTAPEGTVAVNVSMWNNNDSNELYILSLEHSYTGVVSEPTCTGQGYTTYTCTLCGDSYVGDYVAEAEHSFTKYTHNGDQTFTASCDYGCGETDTVTMDSGLYAHLVKLPDGICPGTNLWTELKHETKYFKPDSSSNNIATAYSDTYWFARTEGAVTIPVTAGDKLWVTSCQAKSTNGGAQDGIRITWFLADNTFLSIPPGYTLEDDGCITAPDGALAVCITMWKADSDSWTNELYIKNLSHTYDQGVVTEPTCTGQGYTTYTCLYCDDHYGADSVDALGHSFTRYTSNGDGTFCAECDNGCGETNQVSMDEDLYDHLQELPEEICPGTNLWTKLQPENTYYNATGTVYSASGWGNLEGNIIWSVTVPVSKGDRLWATAFQDHGSNNNGFNSTSGIRVAWFLADGSVDSWGPSAVNNAFDGHTDENGMYYLEVPENVLAVCVSVWQESDDNEFYILSESHTCNQPTFNWAADYSACTADFNCSICGKTVKSEECTVTKYVTATCVEDGKTIYTAVYIAPDGTEYSESQTIETAALGHSFENGVCTNVGSVKLYATNVAVYDGLDLYFYVNHLDEEKRNNYYVEVTKTFADGRAAVEITIPGKEWTEYGEDSGIYRFCFSDISAKEMTDDITAVVYYQDGETVTTAGEFVYSIEKYALSTLDKNSDNETLCTTLVDMLNYGAACQEYFNYGTEHLANAQLTDAQRGYATSTDPDCTNGIVPGTYLAAVSVSARNTLMYTFYFKNIDATHNAVVTYTDHHGKEKSVTVKGSEFYSMTYNGTTLYGVDVCLSMVSARSVLKCTIYDTGGEQIATASDSIEGYAYREIASNGKGAGVMTALMKFSDSAKKYFQTISTSQTD